MEYGSTASAQPGFFFFSYYADRKASVGLRTSG